MITAYITRDTGCTEAYTESFEWGRMGLIEREARSFGLRARRVQTMDLQKPGALDWLLIEVPFGSATRTNLAPHEEILKAFLEAIDDLDLGHMHLAADIDEERAWIEEAQLEFVSLKDRLHIQ